MKSYSILFLLVVSLVVITFIAENEVSAAPAPCGFCPYRRKHKHRKRDDDDDDDDDDVDDKPDKDDPKDKDKDTDKDKPKKDDIKKAAQTLEKDFEKFLEGLTKM